MHRRRLVLSTTLCAMGALSAGVAWSVPAVVARADSSTGHAHALRAREVEAPSQTQGGAPARLIVHTQGLGFPAPFERVFDFDQLPFAGEFRDVTRDGIRVRADGLRHWVHLEGSPMGDRVARQPDAPERWTIDLPAGSHALELRLWESSNPGVGANTCYNVGSCTDTLYRMRVFGVGGTLLRDVDYSPYDNRINTVAVWSSQPIASVVLTAEVNNVDDEFLGDLRVAATPLPAGLVYVPSREHGGFGRHAALAAGRAVIADDQGFEFWRRTAAEGWTYVARRDLSGTIAQMAMDDAHAVFAMATANGPRLRIFAMQGEDPAAWPLTELVYPGIARDLDVEGDLIALGLDGSVRIHHRPAGQGWDFAYALQPDPPIAGGNEYGPNLALDGGRLVVSGGRGLFHVYARAAGASLVEVFRQEQSFTTRSRLDVSGNTVAVQTLEGALRLYSADVSGNWSLSASAGGTLPAGFGLGTGTAVRIDGQTLLTLQDFQTAASPEFRQVVSVWSRETSGELVRAAVFVDPHLPGSGSARLGSFGQAFELDGDELLLGQPFTDWCDVGNRAFFGDNGPQGYAAACAGRSGAAFFASARGLVTLFASGFEP